MVIRLEVTLYYWLQKCLSFHKITSYEFCFPSPAKITCYFLLKLLSNHCKNNSLYNIDLLLAEKNFLLRVASRVAEQLKDNLTNLGI